MWGEEWIDSAAGAGVGCASMQACKQAVMQACWQGQEGHAIDRDSGGGTADGDGAVAGGAGARGEGASGGAGADGAGGGGGGVAGVGGDRGERRGRWGNPRAAVAGRGACGAGESRV